MVHSNPDQYPNWYYKLDADPGPNKIEVDPKHWKNVFFSFFLSNPPPFMSNVRIWDISLL